mmetsp:Transcript_74510/g.230265  ORF Transcript_74510/g.230265 Transcript_74510/m.230265 type:complete len:216 (-) Transcript_74510:462-1109(-)
MFARMSTTWCSCAWAFCTMSARCSMASVRVCSTITARTVFMIAKVETIMNSSMTMVIYHWSVSHTFRAISGQPSRVVIWKSVNMAPGNVPKSSRSSASSVSLPSNLTNTIPKMYITMRRSKNVHDKVLNAEMKLDTSSHSSLKNLSRRMIRASFTSRRVRRTKAMVLACVCPDNGSMKQMSKYASTTMAASKRIHLSRMHALKPSAPNRMHSSME